ncbi:hypothetical protein PUMCH_004116 [Australozyma saopauloensis]|uniref:Transcription and mRNA export factor SUS1 n=1 Tax=Australozyma saopauloensis TaxID=291208 RepID=A0AAX4HDY7_9ASCO|nr:hypothetical protein PUMCH_004116 [[Candida] saopauloensis]
MSDLEAIKAQIQNHLVDSGNYDVISKQLKLKLYECGWFDQITQVATNELKSAGGNVNFDMLLKSLKPRAEELVPSEVKEEILQKIRAYLDDTIQ